MKTSMTDGIMVVRHEPKTYKGISISGFLEADPPVETLGELVQYVGQKYGGGLYRAKIMDSTGRYLKSHVFDVAGIPKIPRQKCNCSMKTLMLKGCQMPRFHV